MIKLYKNILDPQDYEDIMAELRRDQKKNGDLILKIVSFTNRKHAYDYDAYIFADKENQKVITDIIKKRLKHYD